MEEQQINISLKSYFNFNVSRYTEAGFNFQLIIINGFDNNNINKLISIIPELSGIYMFLKSRKEEKRYNDYIGQAINLKQRIKQHINNYNFDKKDKWKIDKVEKIIILLSNGNEINNLINNLESYYIDRYSQKDKLLYLNQNQNNGGKIKIIKNIQGLFLKIVNFSNTCLENTGLIIPYFVYNKIDKNLNKSDIQCDKINQSIKKNDFKDNLFSGENYINNIDKENKKNKSIINNINFKNIILNQFCNDILNEIIKINNDKLLIKCTSKYISFSYNQKKMLFGIWSYEKTGLMLWVKIKYKKFNKLYNKLFGSSQIINPSNSKYKNDRFQFIINYNNKKEALEGINIIKEVYSMINNNKKI